MGIDTDDLSQLLFLAGLQTWETDLCFKSNRDELEVLADLLRLDRSDNQIDFENVSLKEEEHFDTSNIINQDGICQSDSFELFTDSGVPMVKGDEMINAIDSPEQE